MPLNERVFLDVVVHTSFLLSATSFFLSAAIFGDALFVRFDFKTFIKFLVLHPPNIATLNC